MIKALLRFGPTGENVVSVKLSTKLPRDVDLLGRVVVGVPLDVFCGEPKSKLKELNVAEGGMGPPPPPPPPEGPPPMNGLDEADGTNGTGPPKNEVDGKGDTLLALALSGGMGNWLLAAVAAAGPLLLLPHDELV